MPRLVSNEGNNTHPLVWVTAIILAILATAIIITGIAVFIVYMIYKPQMPYIRIAYAHLNKLEYDQFGRLNTTITLNLIAQNDNIKADASFYDLSFVLRFQGIKIAELRANPFNVRKNSSSPLNYVVESSAIQLNEAAMSTMDVALKRDRVPFRLDGHVRTNWRVGVFASLKFWVNLSCKIEFAWSNGGSFGLDCNSKSQ